MGSTEAPRSVNFYGITKNGWNCQWTIRAITNEELIESQADLIKRLEAIGVVPKAVGRQPDAVSQDTPAASALPVSSVNLPGAAPVQAAGLTNPDAAYTFDAERLVGSTQGDKVYWKVQGGKFSKFGVTVWPEVLEAAGFAAEQDPTQEYNLEGYTAYYTLKDDGKPNKVVNLAK
jgi:hypothetical protein